MPNRFNYVKRGYDPDEVDDYIQSLEDILQSYKDKDATIKNAIVNAQLAADTIIENADREAYKTKAKLITQLDDIYRSLSVQRKFVQEFQEDYNELVKRYVHQFNDSEIMKLFTKINDLEEYLTRLQESVPQDKDNLFNQAQ